MKEILGNVIPVVLIAIMAAMLNVYVEVAQLKSIANTKVKESAVLNKEQTEDIHTNREDIIQLQEKFVCNRYVDQQNKR